MDTTLAHGLDGDGKPRALAVTAAGLLRVDGIAEATGASGDTVDHVLNVGGASDADGLQAVTLAKDSTGAYYLRVVQPRYGAPEAVTPNDSTDLPNGAAWGFIVTVTGAVTFNTARSTAITITATAGTEYRIPVTRVYATGTTATGIVALYP